MNTPNEEKEPKLFDGYTSKIEKVHTNARDEEPRAKLYRPAHPST